MKSVERMSVKEVGEFLDLSLRLEKHMVSDEEYQKISLEKTETYHQQNTEKLDKMLNNHLFHMEIDMASMKKDVALILGVGKIVGTFFLLAILGALASGLVLK